MMEHLRSVTRHLRPLDLVLDPIITKCMMYEINYLPMSYELVVP